jgi:hypothetical protein
MRTGGSGGGADGGGSTGGGGASGGGGYYRIPWVSGGKKCPTKGGGASGTGKGNPGKGGGSGDTPISPYPWDWTPGDWQNIGNGTQKIGAGEFTGGATLAGFPLPGDAGYSDINNLNTHLVPGIPAHYNIPGVFRGMITNKFTPAATIGTLRVIGWGLMIGGGVSYLVGKGQVYISTHF